MPDNKSDIEIDKLLKAATSAREQAYAPYSGFKVGAALLATSGKVFSGANVENISLGLTICAERAAVTAAIAAGDRDFTTLVVLTDSLPPAVPCGACRQVLAEFNPNLDIVCVSTNGEHGRITLGDLFPRANEGIGGRST